MAAKKLLKSGTEMEGSVLDMCVATAKTALPTVAFNICNGVVYTPLSSGY